MAFAELEPFGRFPEDLGHGIVASTIANANRDSKSHPDPFRPADFMVDWDGSIAERRSKEKAVQRPKQSVAQMKRLLKGMHEASRKKKRKRKGKGK